MAPREGECALRMLPFDYKYAETDTEVTITVHLGAAPRRGLDLYGALSVPDSKPAARRPCALTHSVCAVWCVASPRASCLAVSDALVKVYAPGGHLLVLDLHGLVQDATAKALVGDQQVVFTLTKTVPGLWGRLTAQGDKHALAARRQESVERAAQRLANARAQTAARLQEMTCATDEAAQSADRAVREQADRASRAEVDAQRAAVAAWSHGDHGQSGQLPDDAGRDGDGAAAAPAAPLPAPLDDPLPPRAPMRVIVTHTQLEKPGLPARAPEAEHAGGPVDAEAALRRNAALPARVRPNGDALDASERHPIFLCDKADTLVAAGAWDAAENAFTAALRLMPPQQQSDAATAAAPSLRARALRGRAACRRHLCDDAGAVADLEAAVASVDSQSHSEWRSAVDAELTSARADCALTPDELRQRGDTLASAGQVEDALAFYQRALARGAADAGGLRVQVATHTNRAALWVKQGQLAAAEGDVQAALQLVFCVADVEGATVVAEVVADTERARQCGGGAALSRLFARRAGIRARQHRFGEAAVDARAAAALRRRDGELDVAAALEADASRWAALLT